MLNIYRYLFIILIFYGCSTSHHFPISPSEEFLDIKQKSIIDKTISAYQIGNNYILLNNQWGVYKIKNKHDTLKQYIYYDGSTVAWEWNAPEKSYGVLGYPCIFYGHSPWGLKEHYTANSFSRNTFNFNKFIVDFQTDLKTNDKKYNLAFDLWIHSDSIMAKENIAIELMIWEDYHKFLPFGKKIKTINTTFGEYDLYVGNIKKPEIQAQWKYIGFLRKNKRTSGTININEIFNLLKQNNLLNKNHYISSIEFGTEVLNAQGYIVIDNYNIDYQ